MELLETFNVLSVNKRTPEQSNKLNNFDEREISTNLPLQLVLYFNAVFLPIWTAIIANFLYGQYTNYDGVSKVLITALFCTILVLEVARLTLGYCGNLNDEITQLAAFWLLSLMLQMPLQTFVLLNPRLDLCVHEVVPQTVMTTLLLLQLGAGYAALKHTAKQQTIRYKITKFSKYDLDMDVNNYIRK